jgi:hypothetical protein
MAGKTRFLIEPIKENDNYRAFIIYFTLKSNIGDVGMVLMSQIFDALGVSVAGAVALLREIYEKLLSYLRMPDGSLHKDYVNSGSVYADAIWKKVKKLPRFSGPDDRIFIELGEGATKVKKQVIIVFAIDEAHLLLEERFPDYPQFGVTMSAPLNSSQRDQQVSTQTPFQCE